MGREDDVVGGSGNGVDDLDGFDGVDGGVGGDLGVAVEDGEDLRSVGEKVAQLGVQGGTNGRERSGENGVEKRLVHCERRRKNGGGW